MAINMDVVAGEKRMEARRTSRFTGKRVHFVGIGGCGMSGLARILHDSGAVVTGSDPNPNHQTFDLIRQGMRVSRDQSGELLDREVDLVVRTAAVPDTNTEFIAARALGLQSIKYAAMLGEVMAERFGIAVAGTHGKSTTTAMIAYAMQGCGLDPSFVIGGTVPQLGHTGSHSGQGDAFVAEACEFDRSFHNLHPKVAVILNLEEDHLDCYKNIDEIIESFHTFAARVPRDGLIISLGSDQNAMRSLLGIEAPVQLVGSTPDSAWTIRDMVVSQNGCYRAEILFKGQSLGILRLSIPGRHNITNAIMAIAACRAAGADPVAAMRVLEQFSGVDRRMTVMGQYNGATVIDDYGHHPTEIRATLSALRDRYRPRRLICVFQPHQHSRTRFLLEDFASSFEQADLTLVPDIYFVRDSESERHLVNSDDLVQRIIAHGQQALHLSGFDAIIQRLKAEARDGDVIVTMGAGNVWEIARDLCS